MDIEILFVIHDVLSMLKCTAAVLTFGLLII